MHRDHKTITYILGMMWLTVQIVLIFCNETKIEKNHVKNVYFVLQKESEYKKRSAKL